MNEQHGYAAPMLAAVIILVLAFFALDTFYLGILNTEELEAEIVTEYAYQFDMIVDNPDSEFWQSVYESGSRMAKENNILLVRKGMEKEPQYTKLDYMNMSIAAHTDGIIVEANGEEGLEEKINEAVNAGIPVVTVMGDANRSLRQSFVGISDYQLGVAYGEQAAAYADADTGEVLIFMNRVLDDITQSQLYNRIYSALDEEDILKEGNIKLTMKTLLPEGPFDAEEAIRDIFQQEEGPPDMLLCMDEETTECARQALIDYNLAGQVKIIGYYTSENIVDAVAKGLLCSTCSIDTEQLGEYSVQALIDYIMDGRASAYYNVDISFVEQTQAKALQRKAAYAA